jgi:hypothetical protein
LVQDESAFTPGTGSADLRMTIGVHNDFRSSTTHSDELWFQGGGRLVYNVGSWDTELNTIIGTPNVGSAHGGVAHEWCVNNEPVAVINSMGNVGVGTTLPLYKLHVVGDVYATQSVYAYSDVRVKEDVQLIQNPLEKINSLNGYTYRLIGGSRMNMGMMAQELESVIPEVVTEGLNGMKGVAYGNMAGLFVEAIKALQLQINIITKQIGQLSK